MAFLLRIKTQVVFSFNLQNKQGNPLTLNPFWSGFVWGKVLKNRPNKSCGRQPLKDFTWSILEYFVPYTPTYPVSEKILYSAVKYNVPESCSATPLTLINSAYHTYPNWYIFWLSH